MQTNYLYPLKIAVGPCDLAWRWALAICFSSVLMTIWYLPGILAGAIFLLSVIWLRFIWDTQCVIRKSANLVGHEPGQWYLEMQSGQRNYVELKSIETFWIFAIIKIRHFGSCSYLVQLQSRIAENQLHKLNLLSMNKISL